MEKMTIEQMEKICPVQFRARGLNRLNNHLDNIKAEMDCTYAKNEVYLLSLGETIAVNRETMPLLLAELDQYGEICSHDNNIAITCINGIYYLDILGQKNPVEYSIPEHAIDHFIDAIMED
jgi:predicted lipase